MTQHPAQHTDERDAYEHILRQMPKFSEGWLWKSPNKNYVYEQIQFGWQVFQTTRLMSAQGAMNA